MKTDHHSEQSEAEDSSEERVLSPRGRGFGDTDVGVLQCGSVPGGRSREGRKSD